MTILKDDKKTQEGEHAARIEILPGQCTVVQCNHEIGRSLIRSFFEEQTPSPIEVTYRGEPLLLFRPETARRIGFCALDEGLYERLKVKDYLKFWTELHASRKTVSELLSLIGLERKTNERISRLSYSEKRLLGFVRSLLHEPELVIWEEPEQHLDLDSCMTVRRMIDGLVNKNTAMLVTCSTLEQSLSLSSRIFRLAGGEAVPVPVQETTDVSEPEFAFAEEEPFSPSSETPPEPAVLLSRLMVKTEDKYVFIDPLQVFYVESSEGSTCLYTKEDSYPCAWTLAELEDKLRPYRFYRCHRSYIVNLDSIGELIVWSRNSYSLVLNDAKRSRIPLSKGKFEELKSMVGI
ncbi:LytTR family transcriptional regulator DNA-binding domain-containing protein [Paenibacillus sp. CN-4]|uniref:LytTR family transcriptional regulator DNA-binding domain-containing protein n=1 Tax=Paenibacillus nanchangensis TaxID=3348343 RepID=UPI003979428C